MPYEFIYILLVRSVYWVWPGANTQDSFWYVEGTHHSVRANVGFDIYFQERYSNIALKTRCKVVLVCKTLTTTTLVQKY